MNVKTIRKTGYSTIAALLLTRTLFASPPSQLTTVSVDASAWNFQQEASDLLAQVQILSEKLCVDSDTLVTFRRSKLSWQSHATQLHLVRDGINQIGEKLARLQEIRHVTSPWQQRAIDQVVPVAAKMAAHTQAAIGHLNENQGYLFAPSYQAHLEAIAERANTMNTILDKFLDLGNTQQRLERLQQELEMVES